MLVVSGPARLWLSVEVQGRQPIRSQVMRKWVFVRTRFQGTRMEKGYTVTVMQASVCLESAESWDF